MTKNETLVSLKVQTNADRWPARLCMAGVDGGYGVRVSLADLAASVFCALEPRAQQTLSQVQLQLQLTAFMKSFHCGSVSGMP